MQTHRMRIRPAHACCARPSKALCRPRVLARAAEGAPESTTAVLPEPLPPLPSNPSIQASQASAAIEAAWKDGISRQHIELQLPLIGATDLDDWPGGIRQQFKAAQPLVETILKEVKRIEGLQGPLTPEIWDQGDAVACWSSDTMAAVVFPNAASMDRLKKLVKKDGGPKLLLIFNPQWETKGLLTSDFGFGPWRRESEELVASLAPSYQLRQQRVYGDDVRVLRAHPGQWQVFVLGRGGSTELIATQESQPTYAEIEAMLKARPTSRMNMGLFERLADEYQFNQDSLKPPSQ